MKAKKENKVYTIDAKAKESFLKQGFDIYSDDGKLIQRAPSTMITYVQYEALQKENAELKKQLEELQKENAELKKDDKKSKGKGKSNEDKQPATDDSDSGMPEE